MKASITLKIRSVPNENKTRAYLDSTWIEFSAKGAGRQFNQQNLGW